MMERLQRLVDESLDAELFIRACELTIIKETYITQAAVQDRNSMAIVTNALNIARRTNRIMQVASQEADNSEELEFVNNLTAANESLKQSKHTTKFISKCFMLFSCFFFLIKDLPIMIHCAKMLASQTSNKENFLLWTNANEKVIT